MQQPACNSHLEKDKEKSPDEWLLRVETKESTCDPQNNPNSVSWGLPALRPASLVGQAGSPCPEAQPPHSLPEKRCESQGSLLQFDRQALGRISTSPTLRRLRGRGSGASHSPPQQTARESRDQPAGSPQCSSKSLSGSPTDSPRSLSPPRPHTRSPLNPEKAVAVWPRDRTPDEEALRTISERSSYQVSPPEPEGPALPNPTPQHLGPQGEESHQPRFREHRRSSVVLNLPGLEVFPGDLLVSDGAANYLCHPLLLLHPESKKTRWPFSKRGVEKDRQKHVSDLESCLCSVRTTDFTGYEFYSLKSKTWSEVLETYQRLPADQLDVRKQQEATWELFTSECTYFLDHLLVLKMIFMNTLQYLQTHEYLLDVDLWRLFANLEELTQTSLSFVNSLFMTIKDCVNASKSSPRMDFISVLTKHFQGSLCQSHQTYCLNYSAAVFYLESLRQRDDFSAYLKWCEQHEACRRLHLPELLVAPLHRLTRYPLLLKNIWKRSSDPTEKIMIYSIKEKVEKSIRDLEGKVKWLDNFQKMRHIQEILVWPPLWDRDKRFFIPEGLKHIFKEHMTENILSPTSRHLLYEGKLTLAESTRFLDVYLFLFDDFLLITKIKRNKKKLGGSDIGLMCSSLTPELQAVIKEGSSCTVLDQPISLDRLVMRNIDPLHMSVFGLRNAFLIQHENRYRQCIAAFLLQAQTEDIKKTWVARITTAISGFTKNQETKKVSLSTLPTESSEI